ncbi:MULTISPECIES: MDR family MFS transporter [unclassified Streptomyces]|uniref:MDR family MFS transporter n=1 Tax=unclassified Streptomyces TaxID=2593676 RepID=UPI00381CE3F4
MLASFVAALDQTVVATSLPSIVSDLGGLTHLSWVVTAYVLSISVSTPLHGKLGDLFGRKRLMQFALAAFLVGSLLCGVAHGMTELVFFRALQGIGASGMIVNSQAIIGDLIPPAERGPYQGYMQSSFALATITGPLIGGFLTQHLGWRWVFYINVPVCAVALLTLTIRLTATPHRRQARHIDWLGAGLLSSGVTALVLVVSWGGNTFPWGSPELLCLAGAAALLLTCFFFIESRSPEPVLPLRLFRNEVIRLTTPLAFVAGFATLGGTTFVPLFLQTVHGATPTASGLRMIPMWLAWGLSSALCGRFISATGHYRRLPVTGTFLLGCGLLSFSFQGATTSYALLAVTLVVIGAGLGMNSSVLVLAAQNAAAPEDLGVATSTTTFSRTIGASFGVSVLGAIYSNVLVDGLRKSVSTDAVDRFSEKGAGIAGSDLASVEPQLRVEFARASESALHHVFVSGAMVAFVASLIALRVRELPLRRRRTQGGGKGTNLERGGGDALGNSSSR